MSENPQFDPQFESQSLGNWPTIYMEILNWRPSCDWWMEVIQLWAYGLRLTSKQVVRVTVGTFTWMQLLRICNFSVNLAYNNKTKITNSQNHWHSFGTLPENVLPFTLGHFPTVITMKFFVVENPYVVLKQSSSITITQSSSMLTFFEMEAEHWLWKCDANQPSQ